MKNNYAKNYIKLIVPENLDLSIRADHWLLLPTLTDTVHSDTVLVMYFNDCHTLRK